VRIEQVSSIFENYATNIDKNTVKTGIKSIDSQLRLQTSSHVVLAGCSGSGKCLGKGTPVRMFDGSVKKVEEVKPGDLLMGDDSTSRQVLSTCTGKETLYRVDQTRGDSYVVNASHILSLRYTHTQSGKKGEVVDINIEDYIDKNKTFKRFTSGFRVPVEYPTKELKLSPYVLGYWLGNGHSAGTRFTIHESHTSVLDKLDLELTEDRVFVSPSGASKTWSYKGNAVLLPELKRLGLINNKHIPNEYLSSSRKQRLELLAGLLDSDGHLDAKNKTNYEYTSKHKHLIEQMKDLCLSLGFYASWREEEKSIKSLGFTGTYYRLYLNGNSLNEIPVALDYKRAKESVQNHSFSDSSLQITKLPEGEYYGFQLDGNHRFLLGDYTVTHNTTLVLNMLENLSKAGSAGLFCSMDMGAQLIYQKLAQKVTGYNDKDLYKIYKEKDRAKMQEIEKLISAQYSNIRFDFRHGINIDELRENILETKEKVGTDLKLVVLDFINRIRGPYSDETANLSYIAPRLSDLANETETLIVSLAQIARSKGGPSTPITDSRVAKGSSAIEESATALLGIWRPGYNKGDDDKYMSIAAVKTRMGKEFTESLHFDGLTSSIRDLSRDETKEFEHFQEKMEDEKEKKKEDKYGNGNW